MIKTPSKVQYCQSLTEYKRFPTREVRAGSVAIGGENPIRLQSMTTTDTMDTDASVEESLRMIRAGCEIVRLTAPTKNDAANLAAIKEAIRNAGYDTPLVADIHFTPNAAEIAARIVEKVRVNPGNYADKKKFENIEYTDESYALELERIRARFTPLVRICKEEGTAMRIGTNHGSLSDRIMSRYGDTPRGMVESAMEFLRICRENDFHDIVLSMKASNPIVMVQAYRLLVRTMMEEGMNYPLHLGVTEAGEGEDGRIKSAVGIGTLLEDGIGDTVRVSLTEDPEMEIPVAATLVDRYVRRGIHDLIPPADLDDLPYSPFEYSRWKTRPVENIGNGQPPVVVGDLSRAEKITPAALFPFGYRYSVPNDKWNIADMAADYIYVGTRDVPFEIPGTLGIIRDYAVWSESPRKQHTYPLMSTGVFSEMGETEASVNFIAAEDVDVYNPEFIEKLKSTHRSVLVLRTRNDHAVAAMRRACIELANRDCTVPLIFLRDYTDATPVETPGDATEENKDRLRLAAATDLGALMVDGFGDGVRIVSDLMPAGELTSLAFGILQATRTRISKTEYISCPSCGRTLFDLQKTTAMIRARTSHLKGVKIGIMGCIVNGPGEMADADYGYVGTGHDKITLYKEKEVVKRNVPAANAVDELIELIREHGDWIDPPAADIQ